MARLIQMQDLSGYGDEMNGGTMYDPTGKTAYGQNGEKVGKVRSILSDEGSGKLRYLAVDVGNWFSSKQVLVPIGMARLEDDGVYLDSLSRDQVKQMEEYREGMDVSDEYQRKDIGVLGGYGTQVSADSDRSAQAHDVAAIGASTGTMTGSGMGASSSADHYTANETLFRTPDRLQLLEERLVVNKQRQKVGEVEISKRVETRPETVNVEVSHEEVVIQRRPVTDARPIEGATLGSSETIRVDVEAEQADIRKQAYVAEEVEVAKRQETETRTFTEQVGREVLEVEHDGNVQVEGESSTNGTTSGTSRKSGL